MSSSMDSERVRAIARNRDHELARVDSVVDTW